MPSGRCDMNDMQHVRQPLIPTSMRHHVTGRNWIIIWSMTTAQFPTQTHTPCPLYVRFVRPLTNPCCCSHLLILCVFCECYFILYHRYILCSAPLFWQLTTSCITVQVVTFTLRSTIHGRNHIFIIFISSTDRHLLTLYFYKIIRDVRIRYFAPSSQPLFPSSIHSSLVPSRLLIFLDKFSFVYIYVFLAYIYIYIYTYILLLLSLFHIYIYIHTYMYLCFFVQY